MRDRCLVRPGGGVPVDYEDLDRCSVGVFVTNLEDLGYGFDEKYDLPNGCFPQQIFTDYNKGDLVLGSFYVKHFGEILQWGSWIEYSEDGQSLAEISFDEAWTLNWILYHVYEDATTTTIVDGIEDGVAKFESGMVDVFALAKAGGLTEDEDGLKNERLPLLENPDYWGCVSSLSLEVPEGTPWPPRPGDAPGLPLTSECDLNIEIRNCSQT